jgi:hypothetical protein
MFGSSISLGVSAEIEGITCVADFVGIFRGFAFATLAVVPIGN